MIGRRTFISGTGAAVAAGALFSPQSAEAGQRRPGNRRKPRRIDTHAHVVPDFYDKWLKDLGLTAGGLAIPAWSAEAHLELNERIGVETSILSVSTPQVEPAKSVEEGRKWARRLNEFCAELADQHPGRFGFFATVTLPDVPGAIAEAEYALDTLKADGVVLLANCKGTYLGDKAFDPLIAALHEHNAVVFVHPSDLPAEPVPGLPAYGVDFLLDTTRAGLNMAKNGWLDRYSNVKFILAHAGGFLPYAAARMARLATASGDQKAGLESLRRFYFDTALSSPTGLPSLVDFAAPGHITFGSDWPYANADRAALFTGELDGYRDIDHDSVNRGAAEKLFPKYARKHSRR
ncbi:MAG: amidohydrolase family protein [Dermatophilus congolensis]|nr:amidohydrolase family protein [Dermatophilus congolensis]